MDFLRPWIPAFAGMTRGGGAPEDPKGEIRGAS